jgi:hypothetical protein
VPQRVSAARSELKATQQRVLTVLENDGSTKLTRGLYEEIAGVSRSQAAYDLAELVSAGILERVGGGRSTWYRLARAERNGQRRWTNERIRAGLEEFCAGRDAWPSASEFKATGHSDLYVAASRYGGISFWTHELGFSRPSRTAESELAPTRAPRRRWRPRIGWAAAGLAFTAALFAAGGASFYAWYGAPAHRTASRQAIHVLRAPDLFRFANVQTKQRAPVKKERARRTRQRPAQAELAVQTIHEPVTQTVSSTPSVVSAQPTRQPSGPVPLPSPVGTGGGPAPLPPPGR